ncbi:efflux RND transporter periplasmic adaptor subunit [Longimicrobium sp.]|uniref:efflux RND transporter periplasmic adaptor subunit n=1 Tax=Longimicrobium sp. TaxID=2029185 RepID=UPI002E2F4702|nr:efflux RND transporter periplasmic adaptor subunit [Longimicrobium sp.]HEX6041092.1 efflux RND transporter periplasmic adaptor subunit [Longimicrobium sp.]
MMDRTTWRTAGALALALALAACGRDGEAAEQPKGETGVTVGPEAVYVAAVEEIATGPALSGSLAAEREARVNAEIGGLVQGVFAEKGQAVRAGQPLARIDAAAIRDQVLSGQSAVRSAELQVANAQRNVDRNATLAAAGAVADRDLETARNTLAAAQAQLAGARAQLSSAQEQLGKTTVSAPISGIVSDRPVSAGSVVQMGGPLFVIVDPGSMRLEASVPAAELGQVRVGAPVRFTVTGYPGQTFTGTVQRINPAADPVTRQVPVIVSIPNAQGTLVSGLFAEGRVQSEARQGIMVPASAVDERGVQPLVVRLTNGKAERVPVTLGVRDADTDRVEITGGVAAGDTLLVGAALGTTPGTRVTVRAGAAAAPAR